MKIDSTYTPVTDFPKAKSAKGGRTDEKSYAGDTITDSVELVSQDLSSGATSVTSYNEALKVSGSIDYSKAVDAHVVTGDASSQLLSLI
jgi:hypothetical protein